MYLVVPPEDATEKEPSTIMTKRYEKLFERIGNGNPATIKRLAMTMTEEAFTEVIRIAMMPPVSVDSRAALENLIRQRGQEKERAQFQRQYMRCRDLHEMIKEMESFLPSFKTVDELEAEEQALDAELKQYVRSSQYELANETTQKLDAVREQISKERRASRTMGTRVTGQAGPRTLRQPRFFGGPAT